MVLDHQQFKRPLVTLLDAFDKDLVGFAFTHGFFTCSVSP
ncbi:hypothetical protein L665_02204 [Ralstonia solanacearum SD54]|nr:hypothetical protein L665_02204 [Ralstonia solanacearum SD54]